MPNARINKINKNEWHGVTFYWQTKASTHRSSASRSSEQISTSPGLPKSPVPISVRSIKHWGSCSLLQNVANPWREHMRFKEIKERPYQVKVFTQISETSPYMVDMVDAEQLIISTEERHGDKEPQKPSFAKKFKNRMYDTGKHQVDQLNFTKDCFNWQRELFCKNVVKNKHDCALNSQEHIF